MRKFVRLFMYFSLWLALSLGAVLLNIINVDWSHNSFVKGIVVVIFLSAIQGSVLEITVQAIATLVMGRQCNEAEKAPADQLTVVLNYNLLATSKEHIDECFETMYKGYMDNLGPNVSAVLVSATNDEELKKYELEKRNAYKNIIYRELYNEGLAFSMRNYEFIDPIRLKNVWQMYVHINPTVFIREHLHNICDKYVREFMVLHRVSRVLRKCGQYQDLMLLSEGNYEAYTYCDTEYYGKSARPYGQPLFHASDDVINIFERKFDYTLVLDANNGLPSGSVSELIQIAAAHPDRAIIQPAIKLRCKPDDTIFMHLQCIQQALYEPIANAVMAVFGQSRFFGKALIRNRAYIDNVIGTKDKLIERVLVDVLSHDAFVAAILKPLYVREVFLLEEPCYNYITWNIREMRRNRGEILLAMHSWPNTFGRIMRFLQRIVQRQSFNKTKVRTPSTLDFVSFYLAHLELRRMLMKPLLLLYIYIHCSVSLHYSYYSIIIVVFLVVVFPNLVTCSMKNYKGMLLETIVSISQFIPEAVVGSVRICLSWIDNLVGTIESIPQRAVEEKLKLSNPFVSSLKHLWGYSLYALIQVIAVCLYFQTANPIVFMFWFVFLLPLYSGFTSLSSKLKRVGRPEEKNVNNIESVIVQVPNMSTDRTKLILSTLTDIPFKFNQFFSKCYKSKDVAEGGSKESI
ncbi:hypothetical protein ACJMK2_005297 [Sinanodonta woodiana]|uniref:Uncharacterized protein n=1 Tax=Sinanodonta woodiana TaxID=1069815 RepID=A0ABD3VQX6_SINWO